MGDMPIAMITLRFPTPQDEHDHGREDHRGVTSDPTDHGEQIISTQWAI